MRYRSLAEREFSLGWVHPPVRLDAEPFPQELLLVLIDPLRGHWSEDAVNGQVARRLVGQQVGLLEELAEEELHEEYVGPLIRGARPDGLIQVVERDVFVRHVKPPSRGTIWHMNRVYQSGGTRRCQNNSGEFTSALPMGRNATSNKDHYVARREKVRVFQWVRIPPG
jgi:hypothetical protein